VRPLALALALALEPVSVSVPVSGCCVLAPPATTAPVERPQHSKTLRLFGLPGSLLNEQFRGLSNTEESLQVSEPVSFSLCCGQDCVILLRRLLCCRPSLLDLARHSPASPHWASPKLAPSIERNRPNLEPSFLPIGLSALSMLSRCSLLAHSAPCTCPPPPLPSSPPPSCFSPCFHLPRA